MPYLNLPAAVLNLGPLVLTPILPSSPGTPGTVSLPGPVGRVIWAAFQAGDDWTALPEVQTLRLNLPLSRYAPEPVPLPDEAARLRLGCLAREASTDVHALAALITELRVFTEMPASLISHPWLLTRAAAVKGPLPRTPRVHSQRRQALLNVRSYTARANSFASGLPYPPKTWTPALAAWVTLTLETVRVRGVLLNAGLTGADLPELTRPRYRLRVT